jgi:hypothetical protein
MSGLGLDVGTSFVIAAREESGGEVTYKEFRDAFYRLKPNTPIQSKMIEKGLQGKKFLTDEDGSFLVVGADAIEKAVERHDSASRPMFRGVLSPKEKDARKVLKFILHEVIGDPVEPGEKLCYSVPAQPIDQGDDDFDVGYHEDVLRRDLGEKGFNAQPINEAEAICYSELGEEDYTGIALSFGAGMVNVCVMSNGESILTFATTKSGDWIDRMVAVATAQPDSVIQAEKEAGGFTIGQESESQIHSALAAYYDRLITYTVQQLALALQRSGKLPQFKDSLAIVISGGTSRAAGFVEKFSERVEKFGLPVQVKEVRHAKDPLRAVARGCMIAAQL